MLPPRNDQNFPDALKQARESRGLSYTQLARLIDINPVMPARYENRDNANFGIPRQDTWEKLNTVLYGKIQHNINTYSVAEDEDDKRVYLNEAPVEEIIKELKKRGATNITF